MLTLTPRQQILGGILLALLMAATRSHHFASLNALAEPSWAIFFLAGVYLRSILVFPFLMALATVIDYIAITWGGVSAFCVTAAYGMLVPAYGALWLAGRMYAQRHQNTLSTLLPLSLAVFISAITAEIFSSGGFYLLSNRFSELNLTEFMQRELQYFPPYLYAMALYVGLAALIHAAWLVTHQTEENRHPV